MAQAVKTAVELIGNANASISHLRREKVIGELNKALLPLIGDDDNFKEATPPLFGTEFAKKGKDMIDQVKALRSLFLFSGRGQRTSRQGSHKGSSQPSGRVLLKPVPCPKGGRRTERTSSGGAPL